MRKTLALMVAMLLLSPVVGYAQDGKATLESVAKAMGATTLNSIQYTGTGVNFAVGQSPTAGAPWPRFNLKSYTRSINYETASLQDELVRSRADAQPRGGGLPAIGEARQNFLLSGDQAWTMTGDAPVLGPPLPGRFAAPALDQPAWRHQGRDGEQGHRPGPDDRLYRSRTAQSQSDHR